MSDSTIEAFDTVDPASGTFHPHANLTQSLNKIVQKHFKDVNRTEKIPDPALPDFMSEALHMIISNMSGVANGNPYQKKHWQNMAMYSQIVVNILEKIEKEQQLRNEIAKLASKEESLKNQENTNE